MSKISTLLDGLVSELRTTRNNLQEVIEEAEGFVVEDKHSDTPCYAALPGTQVFSKIGTQTSYIVASIQQAKGLINVWYYKDGAWRTKLISESELRTYTGQNVVAYGGKL